MKITFQDGHRMELRGTPQGRSVIFGLAVSIGLLTVGLLFLSVMWRAGGSRWGLVGVWAFVGFSAFLLAAVCWLSLYRERLELDTVTREGVHTVWHLLTRRVREQRFGFDRVHAVAIERTWNAPGGGRGFATRAIRARLLLTAPRAAIDMDEAQSSGPAPVEALAHEVAGFLGVKVVPLGHRGKRHGATVADDDD